MNFINTLKEWYLNILVPRIEGMPYLIATNKKKKNLFQEQRFRELFKKRKTALIVGAFIICLIIFGIGKTFSFITLLIACSPIVVIFWCSFGDQFMGMFKYKKK
tara:strand:+ start:162 stop:473 length:312 start_codon:yes stop_codon:yes gene_type:complete